MPVRQKAAHMTPEQFRAILEASSLTQGEAADKLGVTRQTVVRWLSGFTPIIRANANLIRLTFKAKKQ